MLLRIELPFLALPDTNDDTAGAETSLCRMVEAEQVPAVGDKVFVRWLRGGEPELRPVVDVIWLFPSQPGSPVAELCLEPAPIGSLRKERNAYEAEGWGD